MAAATPSASEIAPVDLADQVRGAVAASTSPSEHDNARPSAAFTAMPSKQETTTSTAEAAGLAALHAQELAVADSSHMPVPSTTASMHTEHAVQAGLAGNLSSCHVPAFHAPYQAFVGIPDWVRLSFLTAFPEARGDLYL